MKIVVIGGSGLIGSKLVSTLRSKGHEVLAASPDSGVNTITGEGLPEALAGAQVVVDVANSPSFEDAAVLKFFETSGTQSARRGSTHWRKTSCCVVDRRDRSSRRQRLSAREAGSGEPDQALGYALFDPALDAVLRIHRPHCSIQRKRRKRSRPRRTLSTHPVG